MFTIACFAGAIGLVIAGFIGRRTYLCWMSGVLWIIVGIDRVIYGKVTTDIILGIFCFVFAIAMFLSNTYLKEKAEEVQPETKTQRLDRKLKEDKEFQGRYK